MDDLEHYEVDEANIKKAVQSGLPLSITTYTLPHDMEVKVEQTVSAFLRAAGQEQLKDYVNYCVSELAVNAKKANTKRVYFAEKGLSINNPDEYKAGMASFKKDTLNNLPYYLQQQKDKGLYIKINMYYRKESLLFEIRNNAQISRIEQIRIHERLSRSRQYNSMEDAFAQVLDDSEGAGLGLVVMVLMLKKMGLNEDCFEIACVGAETIAKLTIPIEQTKMSNVTVLTRTIVDRIQALPQFPQNIITVQQLANDPKSDLVDIARLISTDPAMTADILKLVNSAQYMLVKKVNNIVEAVTILGIKGIKNLLYSYGTQKVLGGNDESQKSLWDHSYKTAFYAYNVVKNFGKDKSVIDDVYVGGMLHDMGKIIFSKSAAAMIAKVREFCEARTIPQTTLEDVSAGMNHAEIGALIAEKWNFPELITSVIRYHHEPQAAPEQYRNLVYAVYLANMMCVIEDERAIAEQIDTAVLASFSISGKKQIGIIIEKFSEGFKQKR
ncbi:MAG: HDOD domain-containing protein [Spirochaetaceae bacterium]|jgi:putative nucleotidyltransferase with HDIG domain|nr:HDOD domain-containing protein [Spirochaetaceae bacterium]